MRRFHVLVVQRRQRNVQKKRDARAKLLFCQSIPIGLFLFSLPSLLKLPNVTEALDESLRCKHSNNSKLLSCTLLRCCVLCCTWWF